MPNKMSDVRRKLQVAALELYSAYGYEQTTAAQIAARVGVTERTFFRYFPDKREVLFDEAALHAAVGAGIRSAPLSLGPLAILQWTFISIEKLFVDNRPLSAPAQALIATTPALRERQLMKAASTITVAAAALQQRGVAPELATLAAGTGMAILAHALERWFADASLRLATQVERAFQDLQGLSAGLAPPLLRQARSSTGAKARK